MSRTQKIDRRHEEGARHDRFALETLEPRLLLSAELGGGLELLSSTDEQAGTGGGLDELPERDATGVSNETGPATVSANDFVVADDLAPRHEIVFVDSAVEGYQALIDALRADVTRNFEIHLIEAGDDGFARIDEVLATRRGVDAVHVLAHGEEGALWLGGERLDATAVDNQAQRLAGWREAFSADADLLLYGCDFASGETGRSLMARIAELTGADVAASDDLTGSAVLGGDWQLERQTGVIDSAALFNDGILAAWSGLLGASDPLWFSTKLDVTGSGIAGFPNWDAADLIAVGDPGLSFESPVTAGTLAFAQDSVFTLSNTDAVHYVTADITVGSSAFQLRAGDLLMSKGASMTLVGADPSPDPGFSNVLSINDEDVYVFRPATPGDYSIGSYALLLDDPFGGGENVTGVSLVEKDTVFGDVTLRAGDFLLLRDGAGGENRNVYLFDLTDVGTGTTSGSIGLLVEGAALGMNDLSGVELVESTLVVGGRTLSSGTLLLSQDDSGNVGNNAILVDKNDIFALVPTKTTLVSGTSIGNATLVFDGTDIGLNTGAEAFDAFTLTLAATSNTAPVIAAVTPDLGTISEDAASSGAIGVSGLLGGYSDADGGSKGVAITGASVGGGAWQYSIDGSTWLALGSVSDSNALLLGETHAVRFVPDGDNGETATLTYRGWDRSGGIAGTFVTISATGGATAFSALTDTASLTVSAVNDSPSAGNVLLGAVDEDTASPVGATLDTLFGAGFSDVDSGDTFAGVAVTANTASAASEGVWQYSSDAGANWIDIGAVDDDATALALGTATRVRFLPAGDFNGTPASLSVRALDSSYAGAFSTTTGGVETRVNIDTTAPGATSAFASAVNTLATSIDAVNDDPTNTGATPADQAVDEETSTVLDLSAVDIGDVDAGSGGMTLTLSAASGTLSSTSGAGVVVTGSGTGTLTVNGALGALNAFLDGSRAVRYTGATDVTGDDADTLTLRISDNGNTGSGGSGIITLATVKVDINALNDDPGMVGSLPARLSFTEDTSGSVDLPGIDLVDADAGAGSLSLTLRTASGGTLSASDAGGVTVLGSGTGTLTLNGTLAALNAWLDTPGRTSFLGASNAFGSDADSITVSINDNGNTGDGGGTSIRLGTIAVDLANTNDAPSLGNASLAAVANDDPSPSGASVSALFAGRFSDPDPAAGLAGIAVIRNTANSLTEGAWQYSSDGSNWFAVGAAADGPGALALSAATHLRFVAVAGFVGAPGALDLRGLDDTYTGGFSTNTGGLQTRVNVDTTGAGGGSAVAGSASTLSTSVTGTLVTPAPTPVIAPGTDPGTVAPTAAVGDPADVADGETDADDDGVAPQESMVVSEAAVSAPTDTTTGLAATIADTADERGDATTTRPPEVNTRREGNGAPTGDSQSIKVQALAAVGAQGTGVGALAGSDGAHATAASFNALANPALGEGLDQLRRDLAESGGYAPIVVGSAAAAGTGLSVGYAVWLARGGMLAASLMSSMPAWRVIDPLPVLASSDDMDGDADGDSLDSLIDEHESSNRTRADHAVEQTTAATSDVDANAATPAHDGEAR